MLNPSIEKIILTITIVGIGIILAFIALYFFAPQECSKYGCTDARIPLPEITQPILGAMLAVLISPFTLFAMSCGFIAQSFTGVNYYFDAYSASVGASMLLIDYVLSGVIIHYKLLSKK